jgi:hypothetical protein
MKPFDELTDSEILALTEQQIEYYIDRECAESGIPLLPPSPPTPPSGEHTADDLTTFGVEGLYFTDRGDALRVLDLLNTIKTRGTRDYVRNLYSRHRFTPARDPVDLTEIRMLSDERAAKLGDKITEFEKAREQHQKDRREYDQTERERGEVSDRIWKRRREAWKTETRKAEIGRLFERYVEIADGNRAIAARFLAKAHGDARDLRPDLFAEADATGLETPSKAAPIELTDDIPI